MRILIIDAYHDSDRGGVGILVGLINSLDKVLKNKNEKSDFSIVYRFCKKDRRYNSGIRHIKKIYPNTSLYGSPIKTYKNFKGILGVFENIFSFIPSIINLIFPFFLKDRELYQEIKGADIVISKGGQFYRFMDKNLLRGFFKAYKSYYLQFLILRMKKKLVIFSHTFGPFNNYASKVLTKTIMKGAKYVGCREYISKEIIQKELKINSEKIDVIPDTAFALKPSRVSEIENILKKNQLEIDNYVIMIAKNWSFPKFSNKIGKELYDNYIRKMSILADYLTKYVDKIALVIHNDGQHSIMENDQKPIEDIYQNMQKKEKAVIIDDDLPPQIQAALYGKSLITIGTRLHAAIFSLVGGSPCLPISYTHKTDGIMEMINLQNYTIDITDMNEAKLKNNALEIINNKNKIMHEVKESIVEFRKELCEKLEKILFE